MSRPLIALYTCSAHGDDEVAHPNAMRVMGVRADEDVIVADITASFPLPGTYHFCFVNGRGALVDGGAPEDGVPRSPSGSIVFRALAVEPQPGGVVNRGAVSRRSITGRQRQEHKAQQQVQQQQVQQAQAQAAQQDI